MIKCFLNYTITVNLTLIQLPSFSSFARKMSRKQRGLLGLSSVSQEPPRVQWCSLQPHAHV